MIHQKPINELTTYELEDNLEGMLVNMSDERKSMSRKVRHYVGLTYQLHLQRLNELGMERIIPRYEGLWEHVTHHNLYNDERRIHDD